MLSQTDNLIITRNAEGDDGTSGHLLSSVAFSGLGGSDQSSKIQSAQGAFIRYVVSIVSMQLYTPRVVVDGLSITSTLVHKFALHFAEPLLLVLQNLVISFVENDLPGSQEVKLVALEFDHVVDVWMNKSYLSIHARPD